MNKWSRLVLFTTLIPLLVSASRADDPRIQLAGLIGKAKTEKEFFADELPAWGKLYIGEAKKMWSDEDRAAYSPHYWRHALNGFFSACSFAPDSFPATVSDLRKSNLLPFLPYDTLESTPYDGDFLKALTLAPEKADPASLTTEDRQNLLKTGAPGSLHIYRSRTQDGESVKWSLGYVLVWFNPDIKSHALDGRPIPVLPLSTEAQPARCLTNQMVFYILGYYATTGQLPAKPEDLDKKVALLNPAVWGDKKQGASARRIWDGLLASVQR
jgi:hypothetical protein